MSTDKDLEAIKNGEGLKNASTSNNGNSQTAGVRRDNFTKQDDKKEGE